MLSPDKIKEIFKNDSDAEKGLNILEETAKLLKKRSSIPRKVHQYKELLIECMKAEQKYNKDKSNNNKKIFDDLSVEAAKKKIEVDELLNFFGMKNLLPDTIRLQLTKSKFKRPFDISEEINGEYSDKKSQFKIEVERLSKAKEGIYDKQCIRAINDILISLSPPKVHKDLIKEAIAYQKTNGHIGDYYFPLIFVVDYRLALLAGREYVGIAGLKVKFYHSPMFIDSPYSYDRNYVVEESKELLPLLFKQDQFCDLAMIVPALRDEIKEKYEEKYKNDEKSFDERCLWKLLNKSYYKHNYNQYEADIENPNVFTAYEGSSSINEHSLGGTLTELKNNPINNEDREDLINRLCKHFPERAPEIERHAKYPVQQLFSEKIQNEDKQIQMKGQGL